MKDYTFPYISDNLLNEINKLTYQKDFKYAPYALKLIERIQIGPDNNGFKFNEMELEKIAKIGLEIS